MVKTEIINGPIDFFLSEDHRSQDGSQLVFNGRVRAMEDGENITALDYEQYEGMAEKELYQLSKETTQKFPIHDLFCRHRIGKVKVGETSLHVVVWSKHRKEGLEAISWFISELKKRVPIWKWAILEDGQRIPSKCDH